MKITAHMIVKNEDQWIYYAIKSTLPYVDEYLITDTGSTDNTVKIINSIKSRKIIFNRLKADNSIDLTKIRQSQLQKTENNWIWLIDGDEIYPKRTCDEITWAIKNEKAKKGIVVKRFDLLGDIYHRQKESVGTYELYGYRGHLVTRLLNRAEIPGLHVRGGYPLEGYFDGDNISLKQHPRKDFYITENRLWHTMYLKRSSSGGNIRSMLNRNKYKIEKGIKIKEPIPEVLTQPHPSIVPDATKKRSVSYKLAASFITPIKNLKRKIL